MTPSRMLVALALSVAAGSIARAQSPSGTPPPPPPPAVPVPDARDPWGTLLLSDQLLADDSRMDEGIAVLVSATRDPITRVEALSRLDRHLLTSTPRAAWVDAYTVVLEGGRSSDKRTLTIKAHQAAIRHSSTRTEALRSLEKMLAAAPSDEPVRFALAEGHLRAGDPDQSLKVLRQGKSTSRVWHGEVAALMALGRYDEAMRIGPELVPASCKTARAPVPCALGLVQMEYPEAAITSLERARSAGTTTPQQRAALYATQARIEEAQGRRNETVRLWQQAVRLDPRDRGYRDGLIQALLIAGRAGEAQKHLEDPRDPLARSIQAVQLATSVDLNSREPSVTDALDRARALDGAHPTVVRAWAHHLIVAGRADEARRVLAPHIEVRARDPEWLNLYTWAAWAADESGMAAEAIRLGLSEAEMAARWAALLHEDARYQSIAAEEAKQDGRLAEAVERYRLAHALDPATTIYLLGLGGALWDARQIEAAEKAYRTAWQKAPGNRQALMALISLLRAQGRHEEARAILAGSGYTDAMARRLERELEMLEISADARRDRAAGRYEEAKRRYNQLLIIYPGEITLLHGLADTLSAMGDHEGAAEAYGQARDVDPDDPWLTLGEVNSRIALQQPDRARWVYDHMDVPTEAAARKAWERTGMALRRSEADQLAASGNVMGAYESYKEALEERKDPTLYTGMAGLYMSRWQYGAAQAYYEEALSLDPDFSEAERGVISALAARGNYDQAQRRAGTLSARVPHPDNIALAERVARERAIQEAATAAVSGNTELSRRILEDQLETYPGNLELQVAMAALLLDEGDPEGAMAAAGRVLDKDPRHPGALAALQASALKLHRTADAIPRFEAALEVTGEDRIRDEIVAMELAAELDLARATFASGRPEGAHEQIEDATRRYGAGQARHWVMIGSAWNDTGNPARALSAYETARALTPSDTGAVLGLSQALAARGDLAHAEQVLEEHWTTYYDLEVGIALARMRANRGRPMAARRTLDEVRVAAKTTGTRSPVPPPKPLPVDPLPSKREIPEDEGAPHPPDIPAIFPTSNVGDAEKELSDPYRFSAVLSGGLANRPGQAGENFLSTQYAPIAVEWAPFGPMRLSGEVIPLRISDGENNVNATSGSVGLSLATASSFGGHLRVGTSPVGAGVPADAYATWFGNLQAGVGNTLFAEVETVRAPVTDSLTSWVGAVDGATGNTFGRVHDTWVGGKLSAKMDTGTEFGALGRWGQSQGLLMDEAGTGDGMTAWEQALGWFRAPLRKKEDRELWIGAEAMVMDHDRQVEGFAPGGGGFFTPDTFYQGLLRIEGLFGVDPDSKFTACGVAGIGPQQVIGEPTLYLNPGTYLGYEVKGSLAYNLAKDWALVGHATHTGSAIVWGQTSALLQIRYGRPESNLTAPSMAFASLVHGPPLLEPANCGTDWKTERAR